MASKNTNKCRILAALGSDCITPFSANRAIQRDKAFETDLRNSTNCEPHRHTRPMRFASGPLTTTVPQVKDNTSPHGALRQTSFDPTSSGAVISALGSAL
jgi:hypothetical protein